MPFRIARRVQKRGEEQTLIADVPGTVLRIGRGTDNDLHLDDLAVLYAHAILKEEGGRYLLRDLTGASLTWVNHEPIQERVVAPGDAIQIGPYTLDLQAEPTLPGLIVHVQEPRERRAAESTGLLARYSLATSRWTKGTLSVVGCLAVLALASAALGLGKYRIFMPGEVSLKHGMFANDCRSCHEGWKPVWRAVSDKTCLACHAGPPHFRDVAGLPTPRCATCHVEHKEQPRLALVSDRKCAACHSDLTVKEGASSFAHAVTSFDVDHPEFAVTVAAPDTARADRVRLDDKARLADHAALKLNHHLHLKPDLQGPDGPEQLTCASCHHPDQQTAYMVPITYQKDCMRCHQLDFDDRLGPNKQAPHPSPPEEIRRFLQQAYAEYYLLAHETEMKGRPHVKRLPGAPASREEIWVGDMTAKAEDFLYSKKTSKCTLCHDMAFPKDGPSGDPVLSTSAGRARPLPSIAKTSVPARWLPYAVFDHEPHNALIKDKGCVACHAAAETSRQTSDVLLPGITVCKQCHFTPGGARSQCVECHLYHDKSKERSSEHPYELDRIRKQAPNPSAT